MVSLLHYLSGLAIYNGVRSDALTTVRMTTLLFSVVTQRTLAGKYQPFGKTHSKFRASQPRNRQLKMALSKNG
jgi:hypothetical protein